MKRRPWHAPILQLWLKSITHALAMQIMIMLTREKARPEIPDISTLPGGCWSGIEGFVDIMQVTIEQALHGRKAGLTLSRCKT